jgi:hypothetical protein
MKSFMRNQTYPNGSIVQGYYTEEAVEWALNYSNPNNPIGFLKSRHEGRFTGKETIGNKVITIDPNLFHHTHFHVLQQMSIVFKYLDKQKKLLRDNLGRNESWLANERMRKIH